jgi:hypothetical protein
VNRRRRRAVAAARPWLDALLITVVVGATLVALYLDRTQWNVILPLSGAALIVYFWVRRFRD